MAANHPMQEENGFDDRLNPMCAEKDGWDETGYTGGLPVDDRNDKTPHGKADDRRPVRPVPRTIEEALNGKKADPDRQERDDRRERRRLNRQKASGWIGHYKRQLAAGVLAVVAMLMIVTGIAEIQKRIPLGYSSDSLEGKGYTEVVRLLKEAGFTNVQTKEMADLSVSEEEQEKLVSQVRLLSGDTFDADKRYPSDFPVTVVYHTLKLYHPPFTSKEAGGMPFLTVKEEFEKAGFTNVALQPEYSMLVGLTFDEGDVKAVTVGEEKGYDLSDTFRPDTPVRITYYTSVK